MNELPINEIERQSNNVLVYVFAAEKFFLNSVTGSISSSKQYLFKK